MHVCVLTTMCTPRLQSRGTALQGWLINGRRPGESRELSPIDEHLRADDACQIERRPHVHSHSSAQLGHRVDITQQRPKLEWRMAPTGRTLSSTAPALASGMAGAFHRRRQETHPLKLGATASVGAIRLRLLPSSAVRTSLPSARRPRTAAVCACRLRASQCGADLSCSEVMKPSLCHPSN